MTGTPAPFLYIPWTTDPYHYRLEAILDGGSVMCCCMLFPYNLISLKSTSNTTIVRCHHDYLRNLLNAYGKNSKHPQVLNTTNYAVAHSVLEGTWVKPGAPKRAGRDTYAHSGMLLCFKCTPRRKRPKRTERGIEDAK